MGRINFRPIFLQISQSKYKNFVKNKLFSLFLFPRGHFFQIYI